MCNYSHRNERKRQQKLLTVRVGGLASGVAGRGAAERGDDGVVVRVGVVWVVRGRVVSVVFWRSSGDADVGLAHVAGTGGLEPAGVVLLRRPAGAVVVVVAAAVVATDHGGIVRGLGKSDLPPVAHLGGFGVPEDLGAFQGAGGAVAGGAGAGGVVHVLAGRADVDVELGAARHGLGGPGASSSHDGAGLGVVDVVVVGGGGRSAQLPIVDAGGRHGVAVGGAVGPTGAGGRVRRGVHIFHLKRPLQSCRPKHTTSISDQYH